MLKNMKIGKRLGVGFGVGAYFAFSHCNNWVSWCQSDNMTRRNICLCLKAAWPSMPAGFGQM